MVQRLTWSSGSSAARAPPGHHDAARASTGSVADRKGPPTWWRHHDAVRALTGAWRTAKVRPTWSVIYLNLQLFVITISQDDTLFETIAFLSTLAFVGVFVALFQMDRAGRKDEQGQAENL